ncbi:bifunctional UDP-sugar hydrolase/5'-nucleotidase UshA [Rhodoferax sp.]|uniref:bifunctional UDP-sugar hydrolase/5'-nucleotidase UshA n=1 Tax=Rhodoferax sp. TaxID=50421 RepID=UPI002ACE4AEF|nr:bifunctional UDP-sugar hydrolase/5'-nucleotidase UshA [Rhodoferax sp.]MDZ7919543.1 bifunctional UDP-sugar hydrolase/5'-nucleotidase UshA [Rhodoferax sp.]
MRTNALFLSVTVLALAGCAQWGGSGPDKDKTHAITILHTNDHHGRFWKNRDGEYGMAARKTVVDQIRQEVKAAGGYSLLLDGGDVNTGVPESDLQDAVPDFRGMNLLGYDAMAVGNHEFDKPPVVLQMQRDLATFPMLSANIYKDGSRMFAPYKVFNLGGVRVGVMGLTTEDTQKMVHPDNVRGITFANVQTETAKVLPELRQKADVVIAATHMGHYEDGKHGVQAPGDVELARAVKGLDMIVGGHSQNPACMKAENVLDRAYVPGNECKPDRQNGTWIVQAHEWGKYVGRADFTYRNGEFKLVKYALIPINLKKAVKAADGKTVMQTYAAEIAESPEMLQLLKPFQDFGQQKLLVEVGSSDGKLEGDRSVVRSQPTALGVMIGQSMMDKTKADLAIVNAGGVRDSLPAGKITYKDVLTVHPFGNTVVVVTLTGKEVRDYLAAAAKMTAGSGAFAQFAGVQLVVEAGQVASAKIAGQDIDPSKSYRMAINNFVAAGGDGYPKLNNHPGYVDTGFVDADVLRAYIAANSPLKSQAYAPGNSVVRR